MNTCVIRRLFFSWLVWFQCWKLYGGWTNMFKTKKPSFLTLFSCGVMLSLFTKHVLWWRWKGELHILLWISQLCWVKFWGFAYCVVEQPCYGVQNVFFFQGIMYNMHKPYKLHHANSWGLGKVDTRCQNIIDLKYNSVNWWTWQEVPCTRNVECYKNHLLALLVVVEC